MSLLSSILRSAERVSPAPAANAHCDIPCGIYDPHMAQMAAHTVIRMNQLVADLKPGASPQEMEAYANKLTRYIKVKEDHAELAKHEVRVLWGDYFKPEHLDKFPDLHNKVWTALKQASKARQEINMQAAQDLLKTTQEIAEIFWKTKGLEPKRIPSGYPSGGEIVTHG